MCYIKGECYCYYYFPSHFIVFITSLTDALYASLFGIVYSYAYSTQSPNMALFSCLLRTLGIVIQLYAQYTQLLTSDSSCLISCHSRSQPRRSVPQRIIDVPHNSNGPNYYLHTQQKKKNQNYLHIYITSQKKVGHAQMKQQKMGCLSTATHLHLFAWSCAFRVFVNENIST